MAHCMVHGADTHHGSVDGTNLKAARVELDDLLFEVVCRDE